jgi:PAS domain S-box-containing protein
MNREIIVMADADGIIRFWSAGAARAFGYQTAQMLDQSLEVIVPPEYRQAHRQGFQRAMAQGHAAAEGRPGPFPVLRADGTILNIDGRLTLLRAPDGKVIAAAVVYEPGGGI